MKRTALSIHKDMWADCTRCHLHEQRHRVVLLRGTIPCHILFIGEAPGISEDTLGRPFVGPAGHLLDQMIERSIGEANQHRAADKLTPFSWAFTNLTGCIPKDEEQNKIAEPAQARRPIGEPPYEAVLACMPRLEEFIALADPLCIVAVGKLPTKYLTMKGKAQIKMVPGSTPMQVEITHPAAILRANVAQRGLMMQRVVATLNSLCEDLYDLV